jgi:hypothetical protein
MKLFFAARQPYYTRKYLKISTFEEERDAELAIADPRECLYI